MEQTNGETHNLDFFPSGKLEYPMTNDYMFRAVMQKNNRALTGLLYALLDLPEGSITSAEILNPIVLGESIDDKNCIMDLKLSLNHHEIVNVEMQVNDQGNWPERSLTYLCRSFDNLERGQDYLEVRPAIHIGIIDFHLPHLTPEFYAEYQFLNVKNYECYSSKISLRVLNLKTLDDEAIEKKPDDLYIWAKMFKAQSWEELKMAAKQNPYIEDVVVTYHEMTEDEKIKEQCFARMLYEWDMASGIAKGRREGLAEGKQKGRREGLILAYADMGLSLEQIAQKVDTTEEEVTKILQESK